MYFQRLDPRVRLQWWICISLLAMVFATAQATTALIFVLYLGWRAAGQEKRLLRFALGLTPFLFFITLVSLFPTFDLTRAIKMALRYFVLLGSARLIMATTGYGELTNAIRNLRSDRLKFLEKPLDVVSLIFGVAFLSFPVAAEEWERIKQNQRARGISLGSKVQEVRRGLEMFRPLFLRTMDRLKNLCIAIVIYGYDPFQRRTLYQRLVLSPQEKVISIAMTAVTALAAVLAFVFKV